MNSFEYLQPDSYHFSLDSVEFAKFVTQRVIEKWDHKISDLKILDVCAGSGIVGMDLAYHLPQIRFLDFLEVQSEFESYLIENKNRLLKKRSLLGHPTVLESKLIFANYEVMCSGNFRESYDLILCNPPFFLFGTGKIPPNALKARCHFFIDSTPERLVQGIANSLKPDGVAYFLCKDSRVEGSFLNNLKGIEIRHADKVRNTGIMELKKSACDGLVLGGIHD